MVNLLQAVAKTEPTITLTTIQAITALAVMVVPGVFAFWRMAKSNQKKESDIYIAIDKNARDINEVGGRINTTSSSCKSHDEAITQLRLEQQASRDDRNSMREKIAGNQISIATIREEIQADRLAVMSTLHANERAAAERDAQLRERLAGITERLNIEMMVQSVVRAFQSAKNTN